MITIYKRIPKEHFCFHFITFYLKLYFLNLAVIASIIKSQLKQLQIFNRTVRSKINYLVNN